ncbi:MAG: aryl-sulfate sulfotransferase [Terracidiphilus sp.]
MKKLFSAKTILVIVVSITCALMAGCGAGSDVPPAPTGSLTSTQNPLVAQYTVVAGCPGLAMVEFGTDTSYGRSTAWYPVGNYSPTRILVAGMKASTTYHMRSQTQCAGSVATSADLTFATGPLPSIPFPTLKVTRPNPSLSSQENPGIELVDILATGESQIMSAFFTDRDANPIWYYPAAPGYSPATIKFLPDGHLILSLASSSDSLLREVDLAGNTIRELDVATLQQKLQQMGADFVPGTFHHDLLPLDNGHLIALVDFEKSFTNLPGYPGTTNVLGDGLVDLDQNWNPVWTWNSFDHLDINRHLNGLPDWTHSNALVYSPDDGNILLSMRHQSWILKIDYDNGAGTGNILWHLGYQGDFALTDAGVPTVDPSLWFSFQHFPILLSQSGPQTTLAIWDNGDNRFLNDNGVICVESPTSPNPCYSRATIFQVDEGAMVANLQWADPLQLFSLWGGSINQLENGNVEFDVNAPVIPPSPNVASEVREVTQTSNPQVVWQMDIAPVTANAYRAYRVPSLYPGVSWQF